MTQRGPPGSRSWQYGPGSHAEGGEQPSLTNHEACHPRSLSKHTLQEAEDHKHREIWCKCHHDTSDANTKTGY
jgi:hypothetical protein